MSFKINQTKNGVIMRKILVTGANRGIGLAIVKQLSENADDTIILGCRNIELGKAELTNLPTNVRVEKVDLNDRETLGHDIKTIIDNYGHIDVLINNAGVLFEGNFSDSTFEQLEQSIFVNCYGPYLLAKAVLPKMKKNNYGRIVNISSQWGAFSDGLNGPFSYSVSKATLNAMTLTMAKEISGNIKINSMCPGWVKTRMGGESASRSPMQGAETAVWLANLDESGPSGLFFRDKVQIEW